MTKDKLAAAIDAVIASAGEDANKLTKCESWMQGMTKLLLISFAAAAALGACATKPEPAPSETPQCMNYRSMMTAPMAPDAMERLRAACEASRQSATATQH